MASPGQRTCSICGLVLDGGTETEFLLHINACRAQGYYSPNLTSFLFEPFQNCAVEISQEFEPKTPKFYDDVIDVSSSPGVGRQMGEATHVTEPYGARHGVRKAWITEDTDSITEVPNNEAFGFEIIGPDNRKEAPVDLVPVNQESIRDTTPKSNAEDINPTLGVPETQTLASLMVQCNFTTNRMPWMEETVQCLTPVSKEPCCAKATTPREETVESLQDEGVENPFVTNEINRKVRSPLVVKAKETNKPAQGTDSSEDNKGMECGEMNIEEATQIVQQRLQEDIGSTEYFDILLRRLRKTLLYPVNQCHALLPKQTVSKFENTVAELMAEIREIRRQIVSQTSRKVCLNPNPNLNPGATKEHRGVEKEGARQEESNRKRIKTIVEKLTETGTGLYGTTQTTLSPFINSVNQEASKRKRKGGLIMGITRKYTELLSTPERIEESIKSAKKVKITRAQRNARFDLYTDAQLRKAMKELNLRYTTRAKAIGELQHLYNTEGKVPLSVYIPNRLVATPNTMKAVRDRVLECLVMSPFYHNIVTFVPIDVKVVSSYMATHLKESKEVKRFVSVPALEELFIKEGVEYFNPDRNEVVAEDEQEEFALGPARLVGGGSDLEGVNNDNPENLVDMEAVGHNTTALKAKERCKINSKKPPEFTQISKQLKSHISVICSEEKLKPKGQRSQRMSQQEGIGNILDFVGFGDA